MVIQNKLKAIACNDDIINLEHFSFIPRVFACIFGKPQKITSAFCYLIGYLLLDWIGFRKSQPTSCRCQIASCT
jgi:hypothetical protein